MQRNKFVVLALALVLLGTSLQATTVRKMDLDEMCDRAGSIFRGKVVSASPGRVETGGGTLATIDYVIEVSEAFKGSFQSKDDKSFTTIRMITGAKNRTENGIRQFAMLKLDDLPQLEVGGEYVLLATTPGPTGLSTTVGLGQGCFAITKEQAVNELHNLGLYDGPVDYEVLANDIRTAVGQ